MTLVDLAARSRNETIRPDGHAAARGRGDLAECEQLIDGIDEVYRAHSARCYALALRIVRDRHLAQDVLQEVFESLARHPDRFDPARGTLASWLMTLTHHQAVDLVRRRYRRTRFDVARDVPTGLPDTAPRPDDLVCLDEERARVRAALGQLSPAQQEVIVLAYFDGHTQRAIAQRTGLPLGTVKSRTLHGLRNLRAHLESLEPHRLKQGAS